MDINYSKFLEEVYTNFIEKWNPRITFPWLKKYLSPEQWDKYIDDYEKYQLEFRTHIEELKELELKMQKKEII